MAFLNPLFLLGLAAVAAPIIVHLVRRTRAQRIEFPSLMFVRQVPQRTIRRRTIHNLLLLLLRSLAFLLLVLAFTRPYFGDGQAEAGNSQRAQIVLLDTSFSMKYGQRFQQAKARAIALIDETRGNDRVALVTFGNRYEVLSRFTNDVTKLKALVDNAQVGLGSTDYTQALRGAETLFKESTLANKRLILISDFQASGQNSSDATFRLNKEIKLVPIDAGEANAANLAVTDIGVQPLIYQPKYSDKLTARIAKLRCRDRERFGFHIRAIHTEYIAHSAFLPNAQPGANATTDVYHGRRPQQSLDKRHDGTGGTASTRLMVTIKLFGVMNHH